jgi:hypothetical protein
VSTNDPNDYWLNNPPDDSRDCDCEGEECECDDELAAETRGDQLYDYLTGK